MKQMSYRRAGALRAERQTLLEEIASLKLLLRGTILERFLTCSRPGRPCRTGRRHGPVTCVAVTIAGRQRQRYVRKSQEAAVRRGVAQFHRLLDIANRITAINLELMKAGGLNDDG